MSQQNYVNTGTMKVHSDSEQALKGFLKALDIMSGDLWDLNFYAKDYNFDLEVEASDKIEGQYMVSIPYWSESWDVEFEEFFKKFSYFNGLIEFDYFELKFDTQSLHHFKAEIKQTVYRMSEVGTGVPANRQNLTDAGLMDLGLFIADADGIRSLSKEEEIYPTERYLLKNLTDKEASELLEFLGVDHGSFWGTSAAFIDEFYDEISDFLWDQVKGQLFSLKDIKGVPKVVRKNLANLYKMDLEEEFYGGLWGDYEGLMGDIFAEFNNPAVGYSLKDGPEGLWKAFNHWIVSVLG